MVALLAFVSFIVLMSAAVWSASTRYDLLDSAYFAVTTVTTTGSGDMALLNHSAALRQRVFEGLVSRRVPWVAVERDENAVGAQAARRLRVPIVLADGAASGVLERLFIEDARCLMVLTDDDAANLEAALNARALRSDLRIVLRLFDNDLARQVERAFSTRVSRSAASPAAPAFTASLSGRRTLATIPVVVSCSDSSSTAVRSIQVAEARHDR